jgi:hypothetical protein
MPRPRALYSFFIDADLAAGLKRLKAMDRQSEGEHVRRALRAYLTKQGVLKSTRPTGRR